MQSKFTLVFLLLFCVACDFPASDKKIAPKLKIEKYFDSIEKKYPNYEVNGAIRGEMNVFLKEDIKEKISKGLFSDLPLKLQRVEKCGSKYVIELDFSIISNYYNIQDLNYLNLELYAFVDERTAKSLIEEKYYFVEVSFDDYITFENNKKYCAYVLMSPFMGYSGHEIEFGAIGVSIIKIKELGT